MPVTAVASATFLSDATLMLRDNLSANLTDPISATRPAGQKFVMTSYAQRGVVYPVVTIISRNVSLPTVAGMQSLIHETSMEFELRVWARNMIERDTLMQKAINQLRGVQLTLTVPGSLYDFEVLSMVPVDEGGDAGIHSLVAGIRYKFLLGS